VNRKLNQSNPEDRRANPIKLQLDLSNEINNINQLFSYQLAYVNQTTTLTMQI